jgi:hypothetical protein
MIVADLNQPYVDVKLLCSVGDKKTDDRITDHKTPSGIGYMDYSDIKPKLGVTDPANLTSKEMVLDVLVKNNVDKQNDCLIKQKFLSKASARKTLSYNATSLDIRLLDINNSDILSHEITVDIPNEWQAPCQIEF